jgi:hypothetical protein
MGLIRRNKELRKAGKKLCSLCGKELPLSDSLLNLLDVNLVIVNGTEKIDKTTLNVTTRCLKITENVMVLWHV